MPRVCVSHTDGPPSRRLQAIRDATAGGSVPAPHLEDAAQGHWGPSGSLQAASPQAPYLEELQRLAASPGSSLHIEVTA